jgi:hypothetical protein
MFSSSPPTSSSPPISNGELHVGLHSSGNFDSSGFAYPISTFSNANINSNAKGSSVTEGDLLYEETRKGAREAATITEFMRKRVKIEEEYARALLQLCKSFPLGSKYEYYLSYIARLYFPSTQRFIGTTFRN